MSSEDVQNVRRGFYFGLGTATAAATIGAIVGIAKVALTAHRTAQGAAAGTKIGAVMGGPVGATLGGAAGAVGGMAVGVMWG